MKYLLTVLAAVVIVVFALSQWTPDSSHKQAQIGLQIQRETFALQREMEMAESLYTVDLISRAASRFVFPLGSMMLFGALTYIVIDYYKQRRVPLTTISEGRVQISRRLAEQGYTYELAEQALKGLLAERMLAATPIQPVPTHINYSPHYAGKESAATATAALTLPQDAGVPASSSLGDTLPIARLGSVPFGHTLPKNELLVRAFEDVESTLYTGPNGSGKTNAMDVYITTLHHINERSPVELFIADPKGQLQSTWERSPILSAPVLQDVHEIEDMLTEAKAEIKSRMALFRTYNQETGSMVSKLSEYHKAGQMLPWRVYVLDELNMLMNELGSKSRLKKDLSTVLQTGRAAGVRVLGSAQYLSKDILSRDATRQFTSSALFGPYDPVQANMVYGDAKAVTQDHMTGQPGNGVIKLIGMGRPVPYKALHATNQDIQAVLTKSA